jgi:hypothetical protein
MGWFDSKLEKALKRGLRDPAKLADAIAGVDREVVRTASEAELVVQVLRRFPLPAPAGKTRLFGSPLHDVTAWLQGAEGDAAVAVLERWAMPELLRILDASLDGVSDVADPFRLQMELGFLVKVVCKYAPKGGLERVVRAARTPALADAWLWSVIFGIVGDADHPWRSQLIDALRDPLPEGFVAVAYLDMSNTFARAGEHPPHPFATPAGLRQLSAWLTETDEKRFSHAHSAAAAIPFVDASARATLLRLAAEHPDRGVRLEAAWAAARCGDESGFEVLQAACADPRSAAVAMRYLSELGADERIPVHTKSADFQAMAAMCEWLAHPNEYGRAPEAITQVDSRVLFWPPTDDRRRLWVFRYEYPPNGDGAEREIGCAMVGSVTFALAGEATGDLAPEAVYALHCAWELQCNEDPRAPEKRTVASGMRILARHNPGFSIA